MALATGVGTACLALAWIFTDHAVLQREGEAPVWGVAPPGAAVRVEVAGREAAAVADAEGRWLAVLRDLPAGGPYELRVGAGAESIVLNNILVGDVWLCSGQSNMQWTIRDVENPELEVARASRLENVRLLMVPKNGLDHALEKVEARWTTNGPEQAIDFSAVAQFFAGELRRHTDLPIGLIDSSFGGTAVEAWISKEVLAGPVADVEQRPSMFGFNPSAMFNAMINPLVPYGVKGALWYQGESNCGRAEGYPRLLEAMIGDWRTRFRNPEMPFLIVQLPNYTDRIHEGYFTAIREAQARVAAKVPNTHLAVTIDTADGYDLHPKTKREIGRRLALLARRHALGEEVVASGPILAGHRIDGARVVLGFNTGGGALRSGSGEELRDFQIAASDGLFRTARARIDGEAEVVVWHDDIREPRYMRYAWRGNPVASVYNQAGLPAGPFRTDSLPLEELEIENLPQPWRLGAMGWSLTVSGDGRIDSIRNGDVEFLDNDGPRPGGYFFNVWGVRRIYTIERVTERQICADLEWGTMVATFDQGGVSLDLTNKRQDELDFLLAIGAGVESVTSEGEGVFLAERRGRKVRFSGPGLKLEEKTPGQRTLRLDLPRPGALAVRVDMLPGS